MTRSISCVALAGLALAATIAIPIAEAQRTPRGGGGARAGGAGAHNQQVRRTASPNINRTPNANRAAGANRPNRAAVNSGNTTINRGGNRNNVNVNNVNVNRNVNVNGGGCCHDGYYRDYDDYHPFATAAVVTAAAVTTAAVIGSITRSLPPSCSNVVIGGVGYYQCGSSWYQPQYVGTSVQYVVVSAPR